MIRQTVRYAVGGILAAAIGGCFSSGELGQTMSSWQGSSIDAVSAAWGPPDACETIEGRRICSWYDIASGYSLSTARACVRSLEIDPDGYVTGWRWRGNQCHATAGRVLARASAERPEALAPASPGTGDSDVAAILPAE